MLTVVHHRLMMLIWLIAAALTVYNWVIGMPVNGLTTLTVMFSGVGVLSVLNIRYMYTRDLGWVRLMIPFGMIMFMALFGYVHYLLLLVTQLTSVLIIYLNARHAQS